MKAVFELGAGPPALFALYRLGLSVGHYRRLDRRMLTQAAHLADAFHLVLPLPDSDALGSTLNRKARSALFRQANAVVKGRTGLFDERNVPLKLTFRKQLRHWTDYERGVAPVPVQQGAGPSGAPGMPPDIKFLWEPARFGWAFALGRAFRLTSNEKYVRAFWKHFDRFVQGNPPFLGPHWMNGQEVAIRLLALAWSAHVFAAADASTTRRMARLAHCIALHAVRIPPTLVYARAQNNNHLVTEATALYTAGAMFDHQPWRDLGWRWLNRALQQQIDSNGEYIQHSTNYHRLMIQAALWADAVRRARRDAWPAASLQVLARAAHWLFLIVDPASGGAPTLGANDGALILPLTSAAYDDYRPTARAAVRAFGSTGAAEGDLDEMALWLGLPETVGTAEAVVSQAEPLRGKNSWAHLRASSFRSRHGHMDQLHFDLWWRGLNLVLDPGTYVYNAPAPWDNPLVGTRVHNTVMIDGRDQMTRGGRFLILDWCPAHSRHLPGRIVAHHDGFRSLGIRHERTVSVLADDRWDVLDRILFRQHRSHAVRLHWLFMDGEWHLQRRAGKLRLRVKVPGGWLRLAISGEPFSLPDLGVRLVRAGRVLFGDGAARAYEGWCSPTYGSKLPALSLAVVANSAASCSFRSEFSLSR